MIYYPKTRLCEQTLLKRVQEIIEYLKKLGDSTIKQTQRAKRLLEWNREKLTNRSKLGIDDIEELFAPSFLVIANGREYDANHRNYLEFLNEFRSDIDSIDYQVQEYISDGSTVVMPLKANVKRLKGEEDVFEAILLLKFDDSGKIIHWQEVYTKQSETF